MIGVVTPTPALPHKGEEKRASVIVAAPAAVLAVRMGVLVLMVYLIFAMTLYLLPPAGQ